MATWICDHCDKKVEIKHQTKMPDNWASVRLDVRVQVPEQDIRSKASRIVKNLDRVCEDCSDKVIRSVLEGESIKTEIKLKVDPEWWVAYEENQKRVREWEARFSKTHS